MMSPIKVNVLLATEGQMSYVATELLIGAEFMSQGDQDGNLRFAWDLKD